MILTTQCHCGRPLHYNDKILEAQMNELCQKLGDYIEVTVLAEDGKHTYKVLRHYIALHGIKGKDLSALGFEEVQ